MLGLLLLIPCVGLITSVEPVAVIGQLGSDLHLDVAEACRLNGSFRYDIYSKTQMIGSYHGELQGLKDYMYRLTYKKQTCIITLRNLTEQDGNIFTVTLFEVINGKSTPRDITYNVTIRDPLTTRPYTPEKEYIPTEPTVHNTPQVSSSGILSFVSFCMSLDSPINALLTLVVWILQKCNKLKEEGVDFGCTINCCLTIGCEIISITILSSGNLYNLLLLAFPIILLVDIARYLGWISSVLEALRIPTFMRSFCCTCCCDENNSIWKKVALHMWGGIILLIQFLFAVCVGLLHFTSDDEILRRESSSNGYVAVPVILLALKIGIIGIYCYKKHEFKKVAISDPEGAQNDYCMKELPHQDVEEVGTGQQLENHKLPSAGDIQSTNPDPGGA